jgi:hypothetical protein
MGTLAAYVSASVFSGFTLVGVLDRQLSEYGRLPAGGGRRSASATQRLPSAAVYARSLRAWGRGVAVRG